MTTPTITENSAAALIARFLKARGVDRVFALCGGHIMPMWMRLDAEGIRIIDVRDERAAVYMAHAHSELTGETRRRAGDRRTRRHQRDDRASPMPSLPGPGAGALGHAAARCRRTAARCRTWSHTDFVRPLTRYARTVREPSLVLQELDEAVSRAFGQGGEPGPVYLDFPVDTLRAEVPRVLRTRRADAAKPRAGILPDPRPCSARPTCCWSARRPLVHLGPRRARRRCASWSQLLERARRPLPRHRRKPRPGAGRPSRRWWRRCAAR